MSFYCRMVLRCPVVILAFVAALSITGVVVILCFGDLPNFQEPKLVSRTESFNGLFAKKFDNCIWGTAYIYSAADEGFETRGTPLSNRIRSYNLLIDSTVTDPSLVLQEQPEEQDRRHDDDVTKTPPVCTDLDACHISNKEEEEDVDDDDNANDTNGSRTIDGADNYFCDTPRPEYGRIVFSRISSSPQSDSLFTAECLRSMCRIEDEQIRIHSEFSDACLTETHSGQCCRSWSLGNYVALFSNRSSCSEIVEEDVVLVRKLLAQCAPFFSVNSARCWTQRASENEYVSKDCQNVPSHCRQHGSIIHDMLVYITDSSFVDTTPTQDVVTGSSSEVLTDDSIVGHLTYAVTFLPIAAGPRSAKQLYHAMENECLSDNLTQITAMYLGIKQDVFDSYLIADSVWLVVALTGVLIVVYLYTSSLCITLASVTIVVMSLEAAYVVYTFLFDIRFFPFMNLLVVIVLIGIGVDDMFVYHRVWTLARSRPDTMPPERVIAHALRQTLASMFATSATTAAAFYVGYISDVTVLRCFAVFSGTSVVASFILTLILIPVVVVLHDKWCVSGCPCSRSSQRRNRQISRSSSTHFFHLVYRTPCRLYTWFTTAIAVVCFKTIPRLVVKLRYVSLAVFGLLGVGGAVVVFVYPRLKLPTSSEFQLFSLTHPFERYDLSLKDHFRFERPIVGGLGGSVRDVTFPLTVVWGINAVDAGFLLDPHDELKNLTLDASFDFTTPAAQKFLLNFCRKLRASSYYRPAFGIQFTNCFIESFRTFMKQRCVDIDGRSLAPCCQTSTFPFEKDVFSACLHVYIPQLSRSVDRLSSNYASGVRYCKRTGRPIAVVVEFDSTLRFSTNYSQVDEFYTYMENWTNFQLTADAPPEMQGAWFVSDLSFYDLQRAVAAGTPAAVGVAIAVAAFVAFLVTLDIIIMLAAILSIAGAMSVTVGGLVLLGWELNVVESVTMSVAVGLSIDYAMHYGAAYRISSSTLSTSTPDQRAKSAARDVGGAVAMAAVTSFIVGVCLQPSTVVAYRQLGLFLIIVVTVSFLYATFFFQALLCIIKPCSISCLSWSNCDLSALCVPKHVDKTVYITSESTASILSTNHATTISSETVEMQELLPPDELKPTIPAELSPVNKQPVVGTLCLLLNSTAQEAAQTLNIHNEQLRNDPRSDDNTVHADVAINSNCNNNYFKSTESTYS